MRWAGPAPAPPDSRPPSGARYTVVTVLAAVMRVAPEDGVESDVPAWSKGRVLAARGAHDHQIPGFPPGYSTAGRRVGARASTAQPTRMRTTPSPSAMTETPKATTEVNRDARRNEAVMAVWRSGSSRSSSA